MPCDLTGIGDRSIRGEEVVVLMTVAPSPTNKTIRAIVQILTIGSLLRALDTTMEQSANRTLTVAAFQWLAVVFERDLRLTV